MTIPQFTPSPSPSLLSYGISQSFQDRKYVENNSGWIVAQGQWSHMDELCAMNKLLCDCIWYDDRVLRFRNSCQLHLCLHLSCDYLSTNSIPRCMTVDYHIIFIPLFTRTSLQDSPSYSQVLHYVTTIRSSSVDINSDSLLFISTLDFAFQGTGMHGTIFIIYHMHIPCLRNSL